MSPCGIRPLPCQLPVGERQQACMIQINHPAELSGLSARPGVNSQLDLRRVEEGAISHCQSWHDCHGGPGTIATGANPSYNDSIATRKGAEGYLPTLLETTGLRPEKIAEYLQKIPRLNCQDDGQTMQNSILSLLCCVCSVVTAASLCSCVIIMTIAAEDQSKTFIILTVGKNLWAACSEAICYVMLHIFSIKSRSNAGKSGHYLAQLLPNKHV